VSIAEPSLTELDRVLLVPDPPGDTPRVAECRLVHLDATAGRLIVTPEHPNDPLTYAIDAAVLVLSVRPTEPVFARRCYVEAQVSAARWLILCATAGWQRLERRLLERAVVGLPAQGDRYLQNGRALAIHGTVRDLSMTGFSFEGEMPVGLGELVMLNVQLSDTEVLRLRGQAVRIVHPRSRPDGLWQAGCQFWGTPLADQERIARLIEGARG
jgi:hypothetical protein